MSELPSIRCTHECAGHAGGVVWLLCRVCWCECKIAKIVFTFIYRSVYPDTLVVVLGQTEAKEKYPIGFCSFRFAGRVSSMQFALSAVGSPLVGALVDSKVRNTRVVFSPQIDSLMSVPTLSCNSSVLVRNLEKKERPFPRPAQGRLATVLLCGHVIECLLRTTVHSSKTARFESKNQPSMNCPRGGHAAGFWRWGRSSPRSHQRCRHLRLASVRKERRFCASLSGEIRSFAKTGSGQTSRTKLSPSKD
jgi:hypothetical protein